MVYDHILCTETLIAELLVTSDLLKSVKLGHARYTTAPEQKKSKLRKREKDWKIKLKLRGKC